MLIILSLISWKVNSVIIAYALTQLSRNKVGLSCVIMFIVKGGYI